MLNTALLFVSDRVGNFSLSHIRQSDVFSLRSTVSDFTMFIVLYLLQVLCLTFTQPGRAAVQDTVPIYSINDLSPKAINDQAPVALS